TRSFQPAQHRHHQKVARVERTVEPVGIAKAAGKFAQPFTDAILDNKQALLYQALSQSKTVAMTRSKIGGSTVLSAANIHVIARARAFASSGSRPAWRSAIWNTIAPDSNRARSPSS